MECSGLWRNTASHATLVVTKTGFCRIGHTGYLPIVNYTFRDTDYKSLADFYTCCHSHYLLYLIRKIVDFNHFEPTLANFLHLWAYRGLILHPKALLKVPIGLLDLSSHHFRVYVSPWGSNWRKIEKFALKSGFEAILDFKLNYFTIYAP